MQLEVTCRHGEMSDLAHDHINQKSEKFLTFFERVTAITVTVDFEHGKAAVEILVDAEHKHNYYPCDLSKLKTNTRELDTDNDDDEEMEEMKGLSSELVIFEDAHILPLFW